ncbi:MAG: hypothetical protein OQK98_00705 [Gammaproteobacteria bacterium]|nr:hypothetical protein [Gammaproteobacteria bacterium]
MKPKADIVMVDIIQQIRATFPFELSEEALCAESCSYGCPKKLLEYLHMEITEWEKRLENGEAPNLNDIKNLSKTSRKIYKILEKNNLVNTR